MSIECLFTQTPWTDLKPNSILTHNLNVICNDSNILNYKTPTIGTAGYVLSRVGSNSVDWVESNNNISTIYYLESDTMLNFNDIIYLNNYFKILRFGNFKLDDIINKKILLKIRIIYKWYDGGTPPDYDLSVLLNGNEEYTNREGLSDYRDVWNKLTDDIIIDVNKNDIINITLSKLETTISAFMIKKNSFYSIELL